jgi:hypothetical protein
MTEFFKTKQIRAWSILSLPVIPLLLIFIDKSPEYSEIGLIMPTLIILIICIVLARILGLLIEDKTNRILAACVLVYLLTAYSSITRLIVGMETIRYFLVVYGILWICFAIGFVIVFKNLQKPLVKFTQIMGFISLTFALGVTFKILVNSNMNRTLSAYSHVDKSTMQTSVGDPKNFPNILYLVLDEYSRSDMLTTHFGHDNSSFMDSLNTKGFQIIEKSRSNYWSTPYSLSSSLNLMYLQANPTSSAQDCNWTCLNKLLNENSFMESIRTHGVSVYSTNASLSRPVYFGNFDSCLQTPSNYENLYDVGYTFWASTAFHPLIKYLSKRTTNKIVERHKEKIDDAWNAIMFKNISDKNCFIYAHILAPHPPFLFNGNFHKLNENYAGTYPLFDLYTMPDSTWADGYSSQIDYVNHNVLEVINAQLAKTKKPIIIIQGDHGMRKKLYKYGVYNKYDSEYLMRFTNFSAIYFPDQDYSTLYDSMSNVNTWRVVLNKYFGTKLEMLPDRNFAIDSENPFKFIDVTEKLDSIENTLK